MTRTRLALAGLMVLLLSMIAGAAWAGSYNGIVLDWFVLGGGGEPAESSSGNVSLNGTLGQTSIGSSAAIQGELSAGFWYGLGKGEATIYLPIVLKNH